MKIVSFQALDFMGLKAIRTALRENGLTQFTGKNGAGKSTILKFIEWMMAGPTAIPIKQKKSVVRRGALRAWGELELKDKKFGHYVITRSLTAGGTQDLDIWEWKEGKPFDRIRNQQKWLKDLFTGLSFDPLAFAQMDGGGQIEELKRLSHVDLDFPALAEADKSDMEERKGLKKEVEQLEVQLNAIDVVLEGLPEHKIDEAAIFARITEVNTANLQAQQLSSVKAAKYAQMNEARHVHERRLQKADDLREEIDRLRRELETTENEIVAAFARMELTKEEYDAAPSGEFVDMSALTEELQKAQRTNRAIDMRAKWDKFSSELEDKRRAVRDLTDRLAARDQLRSNAVANAKLPVPGLAFDEEKVTYKGLPLANYGEGEQIRISTLLGVAMNPGLRAMCIQHGEALDEQGLKIIEELALEHDVQILMARVETSGKVGIVVENGMITANNEARREAAQ